MVYAFIQDVPIGEDLYRRVIEGLGPEPVAGSLLHLCVRQGDGRLRSAVNPGESGAIWRSTSSTSRSTPRARRTRNSVSLLIP